MSTSQTKESWATEDEADERVTPMTDLDARFRRPLMSFFLRRIGDRAEAEDLTQQVFVLTIAAKQRGEIRNPEGFVFTVAANLLRDRTRRGARTPQGPTVDSLSHEEISCLELEEFSAERILLGRETLEQVMQTLNNLGDRTCGIFLLFRLEKMKQRDIAARFGIGLSTVEKHVMKATSQLALHHNCR
jgi:RNA polymerase sigma-70 factor (ECF subfamily)